MQAHVQILVREVAALPKYLLFVLFVSFYVLQALYSNQYLLTDGIYYRTFSRHP